MNSERKSFVAYVATAALLLSSLTTVFAAPLATFVPAVSSLANMGIAAADAATPTITATVNPVLQGGTETITGTGFTANTTVVLSNTAQIFGILTTNGVGAFPAPASFTAPSSTGVVTVSAVVAGNVVTSTTFTVSAIPTPIISSVAPSTSVVPNETLTVTALFSNSAVLGTINFSESNGATSSGVVSGTNGTLIGTIIVPTAARAGNATITVTPIGGGASASTTVVVGTPTLYINNSPLFPTGTFYNGQVVSIGGNNFTAGSPVSVTFTLTQTTTPAFTDTNSLVADGLGAFPGGVTNGLPNTFNLTIPASAAAGVYTATATDANGLTAAIVPVTITAPVAVGTSSVTLATQNGNSCTVPSGDAVSIAPGTVVTATALGFTVGSSISFIAGGATLVSGIANSAGVVQSTFSLTPTQLATGNSYTLSAVASNGATIGTAAFYYCPATQTITSGSPLTLTNAMSVTSVTGNGFAAGSYTAIGGNGGHAGAGELVSETYALSSTTPITLGAGAPGVTFVSVITADQYNGSFTSNITPTTSTPFGVYRLVATGVGNTNVSPNVLASNLSASTIFTETAGPFTVSPGPLYPGQGFTITDTSGFAPNAAVALQPAGGTVITTTADGNGGIVANLTVPANTTPGNLTVYVTGTVRGPVAGVNGLPSSLEPTVPVTVPVATTLTASPNSVQTGGTITVTGAGFIPNQPVSLTTAFAGSGGMVSAGGTVVTTTASAAGLITSTYVVSPSVFVVSGAYDVVATSFASPLNTAVAPISVTNIPGTTGAVPGVSNGAATIYFPIGYTGRYATNGKADYDETISVLNPDSFTKTVTFTYQIEGSSTPVVTSTTLAANSDILESVNNDVGNDKLVSAVVTANGRITAQQIIDRAAPGGVHLDSASTEGSTTAATTWDFAEGYTGLSFQEYLTVQNPGATAASVSIDFVPQGGSTATPISMTISVPANSRVTTNVTRAYLSFPDKSVGMILNSTVPVVAGREEYWGPGDGSGKFGYDATDGMVGGAKQFFMAYGSDNNGDQAFVSVINPAPTGPDATVLVAFYNATGTALGSTSITVSANTRETVSVNNVISSTTGAFYATVSSDQPILAEMPQYVGGSPNDTTGHPGFISSGVPAGLTSVLFANVNTGSASGSAINETVYLLNTGASTITVNGTFYTAGGTTVQKAYTVAAGAVVAVSVNTDAGNLAVGPLGASFTTTSGQFVAEEVSSYNSGSSVIASAGTANQ